MALGTRRWMAACAARSRGALRDSIRHTATAPARATVARCACAGLVVLALVAGCTRRATRGEIHFADGLEQLALGDTTRALALFEEARWELDDDHRVLFHIGRLQAQSDIIAERVRAGETLRQAIDRSPDNGIYRLTLGELLQRQRFPTASTRLLVEALQRDPGLSRAWFLLGQNMQRRYFGSMDVPAELDSAMSCYAHALRLDPDDHESAYNLAFLHLHQDMPEVARELLAPIVEGMACPGRYGMLLTAIESRAGRMAHATEVATRTLRCMGWSQRQRWVGLQSILLPDSLGWWEDRTWMQQDSLAAWFWWSQDPTPTTYVNERLLEHLERVVEADSYFEVPLLRKTGADTDRGEIWLRYGEPRMQMRLYGRDRPVWRWIYDPEQGRDRGAFFDFVDTFHNEDYQRVRRKVGSDFAYPMVFEVVPAATRLQFPGPPGGMPIVMRFFHGDAGRTAVEIAVAVRPGQAWSRLDLEAAAWSGPQNRVAHRRLGLERAGMHRLDDGRLVGRMRFEVPAEELVLALQAQPRRGPHDASGVADWLSVGRDTLGEDDLHRPGPCLSDIMLAYDIREATGGMFDVGGGLQVVPRVDASIASVDMHLYFEVYAGRDVLENRGALVVRYAVLARPQENFTFWEQFKPGSPRRWDPDRLPLVRASYELVPQAEVERQFLSIDVSALPRGPYEFQIELEDAATGQVARRRLPILLVDDDGDGERSSRSKPRRRDR